MLFFFFFQAEDGIRDLIVTGVQTCALPIWFTAARSGESLDDGTIQGSGFLECSPGAVDHCKCLDARTRGRPRYSPDAAPPDAGDGRLVREHKGHGARAGHGDHRGDGGRVAAIQGQVKGRYRTRRTSSRNGLSRQSAVNTVGRKYY